MERKVVILNDKATKVSEEPNRYGEGYLTHPRLGRGTFQVLVIEAYQRRCAITGEKTLPFLNAAHIKLYSENVPHEVKNGLLLREDLHTYVAWRRIINWPQRITEPGKSGL